MTQEEIDAAVASMKARSAEGELITIVGTNGEQATIRQGAIDLLKELHGIDAIAEIKQVLEK